MWETKPHTYTEHKTNLQSVYLDIHIYGWQTGRQKILQQIVLEAWRTLHNEGIMLIRFAKYYYGDNSE